MKLNAFGLKRYRINFPTIVALLFLLSGCGGSAKFVAYQKPDIPASDLAEITFENTSSFETRLWTFNDPLVCNEPVVKSVINGIADDLIRQNETVLWHGERGQPFSFYVGFFSGGTTQWREVRQIVTFVPGAFDYKVTLRSAGRNGRLEKGSVAITEVSQSGIRRLEDDEFVVREWRQAAMSGPGWAVPLTANEMQKLGLQ